MDRSRFPRPILRSGAFQSPSIAGAPRNRDVYNARWEPFLLGGGGSHSRRSCAATDKRVRLAIARINEYLTEARELKRALSLRGSAFRTRIREESAL